MTNAIIDLGMLRESAASARETAQFCREAMEAAQDDPVLRPQIADFNCLAERHDSLANDYESYFQVCDRLSVSQQDARLINLAAEERELCELEESLLSALKRASPGWMMH